MSTQLSAGSQQAPPASIGRLFMWLMAAGIAGSIAWVLYYIFAVFVGADCGGELDVFASWTEGVASSGSLWAAALLGIGLLSVAAIAACSFRRRLALLFLSFVSIYVIGLVVLGVVVAPLIWGPRVCV
jgi:hypothetical protein